MLAPGSCSDSSGQLAIDQSRVCSWRTSVLHVAVQLTGSKVIPLSQEEVSKIDIVVGCSWAIDKNASEDSIPRLHTEVRMVPGRAILSGLEGICHGVSWSSRTLCDRRDTIIWIGKVLANTVPVYRCSVDV